MEAFIGETRELLESASKCFLELERNPDDSDIFNELFRSIHTIKGSSGIFDIAPLTRVVHAAEDVLDCVKEGEIRLNAEHTDLFLDCLDQVVQWIDDLELKQSLSEGALEISVDLSQSLRALMEGLDTINSAITKTQVSSVADEPESPPDWIGSLPEEILGRLAHGCESSTEPCTLATYTPDSECFFNGQDPLFELVNLEGIAWFTAVNNRAWPDKEQFDPFHCQLTFRFVASASASDILQHFYHVPECVKTYLLTSESISSLESGSKPSINHEPQREPTKAAEPIQAAETDALGATASVEQAPPSPTAVMVDDFEISLAKSLLQAQQTQLSLPLDGTVWKGRCASMATVLNRLINSVRLPIDHHEVDNALQEALEYKAIDHLQDIVQRGLDYLDNPDEVKAAFLTEPTEEQTQTLEKTEHGTSDGSPLNNGLKALTTGEIVDGSSEGGALTELDIKLAKALLQAQNTQLNIPLEGTVWQGRFASLATVMKRLIHSVKLPITYDEVEEALHEALQFKMTCPLSAIVERGLAHFEPAATETSPKAAEASTVSSIDATVEQESVSPSTNKEPIESPKTEDRGDGGGGAGGSGGDDGGGSDGGEPKGPERKQNRVLRVDQGRIDSMMDLVGELVVAKNALPFLAKKAAEMMGSHEFSREMLSHYAVINRLSEEMQNVVMQMRMVAVSSIFQRFPRLVRDISRKLNKKIRLELVGEETEADKNIIEDLSDPMIHLVRNAIDHGIETQEERIESGKPEEAVIRLQATQFSDQVIIKIMDDGRGINPEKIKRIALEKGVITEDQVELLTEQEALHLIFEPGFSTAEKVSDLSGRGVGMDVVRTAIRNAGGSIGLSSVVGLGTTVTLTLPLSMAVTQIMMLECAGQSYGIPLDAVVETVRVPVDSLTQIKNREAIVLRDRIIPLLSLRQIFGFYEEREGLEELSILIVQVDGEDLGLLIDNFQEGTDVILKPLEGIMAGYQQYSGTALLGDGRVLMVLNLKELLKCR